MLSMLQNNEPVKDIGPLLALINNPIYKGDRDMISINIACSPNKNQPSGTPVIKKTRNRKHWPIRYRVNNNGCHICTSHFCPVENYPKISIKGRNKTIVRYLWENKNGTIQKGLVLRHTCDDYRCINLDHILIGTPADNIQDEIDRGRLARGERSGTAKLTNEQVKKILLDKTSSNISLAKEYGVSHDTIYLIRSGRQWRHIEGDRQLIGRVHGIEHRDAKLTPEKVIKIRLSTETHRVIAKQYNVSHHAIGAIKRRESWKHV